MILLWLFTGAALLLALAAWQKARRTARRLEQLSQMYWELKYQHGELRVHLQRPAAADEADDPAAGRRAPDAVIPLASLRRQ